MLDRRDGLRTGFSELPGGSPTRFDHDINPKLPGVSVALWLMTTVVGMFGKSGQVSGWEVGSTRAVSTALHLSAPPRLAAAVVRREGQEARWGLPAAADSGERCYRGPRRNGGGAAKVLDRRRTSLHLQLGPWLLAASIPIVLAFTVPASTRRCIRLSPVTR